MIAEYGLDNINDNLKNDCLEKLNVENKHLDNTPIHFSTPSSCVSISNSSKVQAGNILTNQNLINL